VRPRPSGPATKAKTIAKATQSTPSEIALLRRKAPPSKPSWTESERMRVRSASATSAKDGSTKRIAPKERQKPSMLMSK
jgi:hypothetical protein